MRGLIIKDLLFIKNNYKSSILLFIGSLLISISIGNYLLAVSTVPLVLLASVISTFQSDEFSNTYAYTLTLPVSRKKQVLAKYLFTLLITLISTYIGLVIYLLIFYVISPGVKGINVDMLRQLLMFECAALVVDSVFIPVVYKFGCEKGRLVLLSIVMFILGLLSIVSVYYNVINPEQFDIDTITNFINTYGLPILIGIVIVLMSISYLLSILFFKRKDY